MIQNPPPEHAPRKALTPHRLTLLTSVAGLGIAVLAAGPGYHAVPAWTSPAQATEASQQPAGFADLVAKVKPAVIAVRVQVDGATKTAGNQDNAIPIQPGSPMEKFFKRFGMPDAPDGMSQRHQMVTGLGSGFFISSDGYAVTNNHVVDHAKSVQVTSDDGTTYTAKVIGTDARTDLALIKVDAKTPLPYVTFAEQAPRIGDWVVAIGNPYGLGGTVTAGIVSARGRDIGSGPYDDYIQVDAPINRGNSGGPTFDTNGNVIGVNTAIFSPSGGSVGIGFDIPADTVKDVVAQLKDKGTVARGWMGVQVQQVTAEIADSLGLKTAQGALVAEPQPGSPAAKAGIEAGDVIMAVNGKPVKDSREFARTIGVLAPGTSVKLDVRHQGTDKTVTVALGTMPGQRQARAESGPAERANGMPHLGLHVAPANDVAGAGGKGLVIMGVDPDGPAADSGLKTGDVILDVAGKTVAKAEDVTAALTEAKSQGKHNVLMRVKSADATRFVAVPIQNS